MLVGTLTVRENIQFSASLRLPKGYTKEERVNAVEEVIKELGLTSCADTKVHPIRIYVYTYIYSLLDGF